MDDQQNLSPDCMIFLLSKAYQRGHGLVQKRLKPYGLTNLQYVVLEILWHVEGLTANELGKMLKIDKATLSGILDRMAKAEWITKKPDAHDKRATCIYPTEKANNIKNTLLEERKKANEELLSDFTLEERVLLRRFLIDMA